MPFLVFMFIALIIAIGLLPALLSLIVGLRARSTFQTEIHLATDFTAQERLRRIRIRPRDPDEHYVDGMGLVIGDITCQMNAKSPFLRCTPNPSGPCEGCRDYEGKEYD